MSTSGRNKRFKYRTAFAYLFLTVLCVCIDRIYALFAHGVYSRAMSWMFLYPLLGGCVFYFLLESRVTGFFHRKGVRLGRNLYNSGIAALTAGSLLKGILDIAGTASPYVALFQITGIVFSVVGLFFLLKAAFMEKTPDSRR